jgi:hypothetical protein
VKENSAIKRENLRQNCNFRSVKPLWGILNSTGLRFITLTDERQR